MEDEGFNDRDFGAHSRSFSTCSPTLRVSSRDSHARLTSGWLAGLYREGVEPSGSLRKVSDHMVIPLSCHPDATILLLRPLPDANSIRLQEGSVLRHHGLRRARGCLLLGLPSVSPMRCWLRLEPRWYHLRPSRLHRIYYEWSYRDGVFRFVEHPVHFVREQAYEGKYLIQTEETNLSAVEAVRLYKELADVERAFANLKDVLDMRPIYHRTDDRVAA